MEVWYRSEEDEIAGIDSNCVCVKIRKVVRVRARDLIADAIKELTTQHKFTVAHLSSAFQFGFFFLILNFGHLNNQIHIGCSIKYHPSIVHLC